MTDQPTKHVTYLELTPELIADHHFDLLQVIQEWSVLTLEEREQRIRERDQHLAAESTMKCGDLLDVLTGLFDHRHTYACQEPLGHDGEHYGPELADDDECAHREWDDDHPGRRANR